MQLTFHIKKEKKLKIKNYKIKNRKKYINYVNKFMKESSVVKKSMS